MNNGSRRKDSIRIQSLLVYVSTAALLLFSRSLASALKQSLRRFGFFFVSTTTLLPTQEFQVRHDKLDGFIFPSAPFDTLPTLQRSSVKSLFTHHSSSSSFARCMLLSRGRWINPQSGFCLHSPAPEHQGECITNMHDKTIIKAHKIILT